MAHKKDIDKPDKATLDAWLDDPNNYKWKYFYYNPKDKRILPLARRRAFGIGASGQPITRWIVNFSNPLSILALIGILSGIIGIFQFLVWLLA